MKTVAQTVATTPLSAAGRLRLGTGAWVGLATLALLLAVAVVQPRVLAAANLSNVVVQASYLFIFALAQTFVLIARGFDLSIGNFVSLVSVATMLVMSAGDTGLGASLAGLALAFGLAIGWGALNGIGIAVLRVNPFVTTLATMNIAMGLASTMSGGQPVTGLPAPLRHALYEAAPLGLPAPVWIALGCAALAYWILHYTVMGRALYVIGSNPRAAFVAGMPVKRYTLLAYMLCSVFVAVGALLLTARTGSGEPNLGGSLTMEALAAAVIGGASLQGGIGGVLAPLAGALLITVLSNAMNLLQIDGYLQQIALGVAIVVSLFGDRARLRR